MIDKKVTPWIIASALFMETLDTTILSTAMPAMAQSFSVNPLDIKLALISYVLSLAIFIPISGWVADRLGTKTTFMYAIIVFILSSVGCGMSRTLPWLVVGRVVQGIGGAMMMPVGRLIMLYAFDKQELLRAMNFMTTPALLGPLLGPLVGGWITTYYSWPWIFYINVPIGILGLFAAFRYIKNIKKEECPPFDGIGFILFSASTVFLFILVELISLQTFSLKSLIACFLLAGLGFYGFYLHYRKTVAPLIEIKLFKLKTFFVAALGNLFSRLGINSVFFLLPLFFQVAHQLSPFHSGLLTCAWTVGMLSIKYFQRTILCRFGFSKILPLCALLNGITIMCFSQITLTTPYIPVALLYINGICCSLHFLGMNTLYYARIEDSDKSSATTIVSTIQYLSNALGIGISALVLQFFIGWHIHLSPGLKEPFKGSFIVTGGCVCLAAFIFLFLKPSDGRGLLKK